MRKVFKGKQFDKRVIIEAVGLYCRFSLSYRDVSEILGHRGSQVNPIPIMRWVHQYGKLLFVIWKKKKTNFNLLENGRNLYKNKRKATLPLSCH